MRRLNQKFLMLGLALAVWACNGGGDEEPTAQELVVEALAKTWEIAPGSSVVFQGLDASVFWADFELSFTDRRNFTAVGVPSGYSDVWPASGTFTFPDPDDPNLIERSDGVFIRLEIISETKVDLVFDLEDSGGNAFGTGGSYRFSLVPSS